MAKRNQISQPKSVRYSVFLIYVQIILAFFNALMSALANVFRCGGDLPLRTGSVILALIVATGLFIAASKLSQGRNWARILFVILLALSSLGVLCGLLLPTSFRPPGFEVPACEAPGQLEVVFLDDHDIFEYSLRHN